MTEDIFDITIIGGGPAGMFGSFYAGLRHARTKVIEASDKMGGALVWEYPDEILRDVAGFRLITASKLAERLLEQAAIYEHPMVTGQKVSELSYDEKAKIWTIKTDKETHFSRTVLLGLGRWDKIAEKARKFASMLAKLGVKTDKRGIVVSENMETGVPGLFTCGDIRSKPDDQKTITSANADVAIAVNNAVKFFDPDASKFPGYSTDLQK